jgi:hypothetical protein
VQADGVAEAGTGFSATDCGGGRAEAGKTLSAANYRCGTRATQSGRDPSETTAAFAERKRTREGIEGSDAGRDCIRAQGKKAAEQVSPNRGILSRPEYTMKQIPLHGVSALGQGVQRTGIVHHNPLQSASRFCHLQTQYVWQACCTLQMCRSRHLRFSWRHKRDQHAPKR